MPPANPARDTRTEDHVWTSPVTLAGTITPANRSRPMMNTAVDPMNAAMVDGVSDDGSGGGTGSGDTGAGVIRFSLSGGWVRLGESVRPSISQARVRMVRREDEGRPRGEGCLLLVVEPLVGVQRRDMFHDRTSRA